MQKDVTSFLIALWGAMYSYQQGSHRWKHFWSCSWKLPLVLTLPCTNQCWLLQSLGHWLNISKLPKAYGTKTNEDGWWRRWGHNLESITQCDHDIMRLYFSLYLLTYILSQTRLKCRVHNMLWKNAYEIYS